MLSGKCLCGEVNVQLAKYTSHIHACHCAMCRTWGGGPLYTVQAGTGVTFKGEDAITRFASSQWAERGFCHRCGTHLFYLYKETQEYYLPAGLFNEPSFTLESDIFVDEKASYYPLSPDTKKMTGAEIIAAFAKESLE